ncbi:MAG: ATP-binding cassette domain-containing protein [Oscillospiraceae bacterium]|nr:ATP-binding cassette domain-containing protein [Oscillospiraceae bacterium]
MLEVKGLHKSFGDRQVLSGCSLKVGEGRIIGLLGLSGAGKSTLLRCIAGLLRPEWGTIRLRGGGDPPQGPAPHRLPGGPHPAPRGALCAGCLCLLSGPLSHHRPGAGVAGGGAPSHPVGAAGPGPFPGRGGTAGIAPPAPAGCRALSAG